MIGLLLIYFIGKHFYQLAYEYDKHEWTFGVLGVVVYYVGSMFAVIPLLFVYDDPSAIEQESDLLLGLIGIPFGILACYLFHSYLNKKWSRNEAFAELDDDILDRDFIENDNDSAY